MSAPSRHRPIVPSVASNTGPRPPHQSLAKRLLFNSHPSNDLPPLFSSDVPSELTAELYDFIALALRAHINPWWTKITRYDKDFLPQITRTLIVVIQSLEVRIQALDIAPIVFQDLPAIITQHYRDYRNASIKISTSYATGGAASLPQLFHHLQPHMAVYPDGKINHEYYRQVIDYILKACLPLEDYEPEAERFIIREVVLKVLLDDVIPKITQPWFIHKAILEQLDLQDQRKFTPQVSSAPPPSFSFHHILIIILSTLQSFSGACLALVHAYKHAINTIKLVNHSPLRTPQPPPPNLSSSHLPYFESPNVVQSRFSIHSQPLSSSPTASISSTIGSSFVPQSMTPSNAFTTARTTDPIQSNYTPPVLILLAEIFAVQERFVSSTFFTILSIFAALLAPFLDKLLPHLLRTTLSTTLLLNVTRTAKRTLYPNGFPGSAPLDPTPEEQAELRARLVQWRGEGGLVPVLSLFLGPYPSKTLEAALNPLSNAPCNAHLAVMIFDRIIAALFPELVGAVQN